MSHRLNSTSVADAKSSLTCSIERHPADTALEALDALAEAHASGGQVSRKKMLATMTRKGAKAVADSDEAGGAGTVAGDYYADVPTSDLREWVQLTVDDDPAAAARDMIATLKGLRGEYGTASRRKILAAGVGKAVKTLAGDLET